MNKKAVVEKLRDLANYIEKEKSINFFDANLEIDLQEIDNGKGHIEYVDTGKRVLTVRWAEKPS